MHYDVTSLFSYSSHMIYPAFCVMSSLFNSSHSNILIFNRLNRNVMSDEFIEKLFLLLFFMILFYS